MQRKATMAAALVAAAALGACGSTVATPSASTAPPTAGSTTTSAPSPPTTAAPPTSTTSSTTTTPATSPSTILTTQSDVLPISVQTDAQMVAAGNQGPSSSILAPTRCTFSGATVSATGGYTNGGLAPEVYDRYGDIVRLYVDTAAQPGYQQGVQLADLGSETSPPIGGRGTWSVSAPVQLSLGAPARCVVAAQPTHDVQLAP